MDKSVKSKASEGERLLGCSLPDGRMYESGHECGARWDDPAFSIDWPAHPVVISDRDRVYPDFVR